MRQRISINQLNELTDEQKERLRKWWKNGKVHFGDLVYTRCNCSPPDPRNVVSVWSYDEQEIEFYNAERYGYSLYKDCLPLLSVGQCIELLGHKLQKIEYDFFINNYYVSVLNIGTNGKTELIDALFAAVKEAL